MNSDNSNGNDNQQLSGRRMSRQEIIDAVTEGKGSKSGAKQMVVIPPTASQADFQQIAENQKINSGSKTFTILKQFCEGKKASETEATVLAQRMKGLSDEQINILEKICSGDGFTIKQILSFIQSIKRFGSEGLLVLSSFVELDGFGPGPLTQFFMTTLPQGNRKDMGDEAYENELMEKTIRIDQINVFYNICSRLDGITTTIAIALIPKIRQLKKQHALMINTFMKPRVCFGTSPIGNANITGLINLWLTLPEFREQQKVKTLIKKVSKEPENKKTNFQYLVQRFKAEADKEASPDKPKTGFGRFFK